MDSDLSKTFGSVRSAHAYDQRVSSTRQASSSFVNINQKRSWRPTSSLFQPILDYMSSAPFALAAANPFLRLFVERNAEGGGFSMRDYQVTPILLGQSRCGCDSAGGADALTREGITPIVNGGLFGGCDALGDSPAAAYSGACLGTSGLVVEEDGVMEAWCGKPCDDEKIHDDDSGPRSGASARVPRVIPLYISGVDAPQGLSPLSNHCYPYVGVNRVAPSTTQAVSLSLKSSSAAAADMRDRMCLWEFGAALHLLTLGAWWLSRYYGVSLRLHHVHPAQLAAFKAAQRALSPKEIQLENCVISEDLLQCISTCSDLLSLSIISCSASQQVTLRCIDSILRKGNEMRPVDFSDAHGTTLNVTNWYLSGVRSLGSLKQLRCLHILHTPLHETFLQALTTCSSLECIYCIAAAHLQSLSLHGLSVTDTDLLSLTGCTQLRQLVLDECRQITDLSFLANLRGTLERLLMPRTLLSNANMQHIGLCDKLVELHLQSLRQLTDIGVLKDLTALRVLNLSDNLVTTRAAECTDLRYLNLCGCSELRRLSWLQKMSSLRWLNLGGTRVTDEETKRYLPCTRNLRFLSLSGCSSVRSLFFAVKLPQLEYLNLESTSVADSELACLCHCRKLRYLSLESCVDIRDVSPLCALPALLELNISLTAVGASTGGALSTTSGGSDGRSTPHGSSTFISSTSSAASARSTSPLIGASRFPVVQVLHLNGCSRMTRLEELSRCYPQLRVLYADRISVMPPRGVGIGFTGMDERRRLGTTPRHRGLLQHTHSVGVSTDEPNSEGPPGANKSVAHIHQALQQYLPQPPAGPRPRTPHAVASRHHSYHRVSSCGNEPRTRSRTVSLRFPGEAARVLRLVLRRSSVTDAMLEQLCVTFACVSCLDLTRCTEVQCLSGLENLYALRELTLTQSSVDNDGVRVVSACETLEVLRLTECRGVSDVNSLGGLRKLRVLCVARTQVTNQGLEGIGQCLALQYLNCAECRYLSDVNALSSLKHLIELHLERTDVVDAGICGVMRCSALQRVYFTRCQRLTTMGDVRTLWPQLEVLDVYGTSIPTRVAGQGQQFACAVI
ncbi:hypothetical protein CGC20_27520 [Leishmania donovani]|uniref:Leucine Rich repeat family protein n=1 Tax=Leishmania donovani TaxID=5661 RepID=A0A504WZ81_LEIDO|nr:hypothetical protein CGC20_27520 [Leishmania donovani]